MRKLGILLIISEKIRILFRVHVLFVLLSTSLPLLDAEEEESAEGDQNNEANGSADCTTDNGFAVIVISFGRNRWSSDSR